ncbi:ATP-binding protein [bacterium]|nr:ATP-binding protein [bacterium]MBU1615663.1 ATP-binding protein [bacterium]
MEEIYYTFNPWWEGRDFDFGVIREGIFKHIGNNLSRKQIDIMVGSRRAGKTTFTKQLIQRALKEGIRANEILYLALDHPQLSGQGIAYHLKFFRRLFAHPRGKKLFLFLDEVQESPNWEAELKSIYDLEDIKMVCTGSTSSLIRSQGGKLTGRQFVTTIYPLNFKEFLAFKKVTISRAEDYRYENLVEEYLHIGGYPENVLEADEQYLSNLLDDIIARDLVRLFQIRKPNLLKDLLRLLAASVGSRTSFNKLSNILHVAVDTVKEYIGYFESAFSVKPLEKWTTSYSQKVYAPKKIYLGDTGMKSVFTGKGDLGAKAENAVFLHLLREGKPCGYYAENGKEVDFILRDLKCPLPVEVKYISHFDWQDKGFAGVKLFLRRFPQTKEVVIVSKDVETETKEGEAIIRVIPLWKFLL